MFLFHFDVMCNVLFSEFWNFSDFIISFDIYRIFLSK